LKGIPCPADLAVHLRKDNMLLKVAMRMLLEKTAKVKKIYRARKYLYEFTRPGIDCVTVI